MKVVFSCLSADAGKGNIPVNGLCQNGVGFCDEDLACRQLDDKHLRSDIARLFKDSTSVTLNFLANNWYSGYAASCYSVL